MARQVIAPMRTNANDLAKIRADCEALIYDLEHPASVPAPPQLAVPPPDLTPPGFDESRLRAASMKPERSAHAVMQRLQGATAGSAESGFIEATWRQPAFKQKKSAAEVTLSACGSTNGSQTSFVESDWRWPSLRPSPAGEHALLQAPGGAAAKLVHALPRMSTVSPPFATETTPEHVFASPAASQVDAPPTEVAALLAVGLRHWENIPVQASTLGDKVRKTATSLAALPSGPTPPTAPQLLQPVINTLKRSGPVPAYIAFLSMVDEKSTRETFGFLKAPRTDDERRTRDLSTAKVARSIFEAIGSGDYALCKSLSRDSQRGLAINDEVVKSLYGIGKNVLAEVAQLARG